MATSIALRLRVNNNTGAIQSHGFLKLFSSSSSSSPFSNPKVDDENTTQPPSSQPSRHSFISDIKAQLRVQPPQQQRQTRSPLSPRLSTEKPHSSAGMEKIIEGLAEFRSRSAAPPPRRENPSSPDISFAELYKRNVMPEGQESSNSLPKGGRLNFDRIREKLGTTNQYNTDGAMPFSRLPGKSFRFPLVDPNQSERPPLIGGVHHNLPTTIFGKEIRNKSGDESSNATKMKYIRTYTKEELGQMLRELRPEEAKGSNKAFSLEELNKRLIKLRELEKTRSTTIPAIDVLKESIYSMSQSEASKKSMIYYKLEDLSKIGGTPEFMLKPPKEHLVEKYFHPDNMSSAEKMKLELKRVRDEFKMSESDCGSSRVQVAMLTTKIKHLSTALHKKDKHSRKGLQAMVNKRKKLLKYMRRTDWDSYCLVLSKLGLRDNPDYKN